MCGEEMKCVLRLLFLDLSGLPLIPSLHPSFQELLTFPKKLKIIFLELKNDTFLCKCGYHYFMNGTVDILMFAVLTSNNCWVSLFTYFCKFKRKLQQINKKQYFLHPVFFLLDISHNAMVDQLILITAIYICFLFPSKRKSLPFPNIFTCRNKFKD